jgi:hypothetical protein
MTTVGLPVDEMAHRAVDLLIDLIGGARPQSVVVKTPPVLKIRQSTAPPRVGGLNLGSKSAYGMETFSDGRE